MISGVTFETRGGEQPVALERADVACFVGFVRRSEHAAPQRLLRWWREESWLAPEANASADLLGFPVPVESWSQFREIFEPGRPIDDGRPDGAWSDLALAIHGFFEQGGQRCVVIRVGDPWPVAEPIAEVDREERFRALLPTWRGASIISLMDRSTWTGAAAVLGLPEVSMLLLPDLCTLSADAPEPITLPTPDPGPEPVFTECATPLEIQPTPRRLVSYDAPRSRRVDSLKTWRDATSTAAKLLSRHRRDVQLIVSLPLLGGELGGGPLDFEQELGWTLTPEAGGLASAFVQLTWPWCRWSGSRSAPGNLTPPAGLVAGTLARSALTKGSHRSAGGQGVVGISGLEPELSRAQIERVGPWATATRRDTLGGRVTLIGTRPGGFALTTDVTTSRDGAWRPGAINRMYNALVRHAARAGQQLVFEPHGPRTWEAARATMAGLLSAFWEEGALGGASPAQAFDVRCDHSTHTQADLDQGRLICEVSFQPAYPIERIRVVLALGLSGPDPRALKGVQ